MKKSPHPQASLYYQSFQRDQIRREIEVYQQLPASHDRLIKMLACTDDDDDEATAEIVLQYMPLGDLDRFLRTTADITIEQRHDWAIQATEAVVLLHTYGIIHADIRPANMLLDTDLGLRIIDFAGSSVNGKDPLCLEETRFFLPRSIHMDTLCTVATDIFALGSSIYQIFTSHPPYHDLEAEEVQARFTDKVFPDLGDVPYQDVIRACWLGDLDSPQAVLHELNKSL